MRFNGIEQRTISLTGNPEDGFVARAIAQRSLPFEQKMLKAQTGEEVISWISDMDIRGAGAIGTAGAISTVLLLHQGRLDLIDALKYARPTAHNLEYAVDRVMKAWKESGHSIEAAMEEAIAIGEEDLESCKKIGINGMNLVVNKTQLTICNAGGLAFTGYPGSALAPAYTAHELGYNVQVISPTTYPRRQGSLTAEELHNHGVPVKILPDFAIGTKIAKGDVDVVIVGADRIAASGDTANKLGTLVIFVLAEKFGIPRYIAAPTSTIDLDCANGDEIIIEQRSQDEVHYVEGWDEEQERMVRVRVTPYDIEVENPSFDVTPAELITGIITEKGIFSPHEVWRAKTA